MKKALIIIIQTFFIFSCSSEGPKNSEPKELVQPARLEVEIPELEELDDQDSTVNEFDSLGLKTGKWETVVDGEVWKTEFYKNGKLNGIQTQKLNSGEIVTTNYANGLKNGYAIQTIEGAKVPNLIMLYFHNKVVFSTFPEQLLAGNFKKILFSTELDSLDLKINYNSGKTLYQGKLKKENSIKGIPVGIHQVFYENGKTKFLLNFDQDSIYSFNKKGDPIDTNYFNYEKKNWPVLDAVEVKK